MNKKVIVKIDDITITMEGPADSGISLVDIVAELSNLLLAWGFRFGGDLDIVEPEDNI